MSCLKTALLAIFCLGSLLMRDSEGACGKPFFRPILPSGDGVGSRISNGIEARKHSHPWQVFLVNGKQEPYQTCGGSLIDWNNGNASDLVLTAAHCVVDMSGFDKATVWEEISYAFTRLFNSNVHGPVSNVSNIRIYLGVHDLEDLSSSVVDVGVSAVAVGEFNKVASYDDLALVKLEREVPYNEFIQGICLPGEKKAQPPAEGTCLVTGWGIQADGKEANKLQQVNVQLFKGHVNSPLFRKDRMLCTRANANNARPLEGDSGGPLICLKNDTFVLYGVVSFGIANECQERTDKDAFMKLTYYLDWLRRTIAGLQA
uniref:Peptidase S1 domain-containing protein n=1 Tax=Trichuris muris TaxID=70415 RepID=A0A5S6QGY9_TRIMR